MEIAELLMALGVLFLAGLVADQAGRFTRLPRVTMLLLTGVTPTERCKAHRLTEVTLTEVTPTDRSNADRPK